MKKLLLPLLLALPCVSFGASFEMPISCDLSPKAFFEPLIQSQLLQPKPFKVVNSVNFFKPKLFKHITVLGLPVESVYGFVQDQIMFIHGSQSHDEVYGVIVKESVANVQAQLTANGITKAKINRLNAELTQITCFGS